MNVRQAKMSDVDSIHTLICNYAEQGLLLPRSLQSLYENLQVFSVAVTDDDEVVGVAGLHILWHDLAEVRSLAVAPGHQGAGLGSLMIQHLIDQAYQLEIARVFALTYQVSFFERLGFSIVKKETMPQKVWKDCINCPKFTCCDEVALVYQLPIEAKSNVEYQIPESLRHVI